MLSIANCWRWRSIASGLVAPEINEHPVGDFRHSNAWTAPVGDHEFTPGPITLAETLSDARDHDGDRVVLDHYSGQPGVVVRFGTEYQDDLRQVNRRATERELRSAREKRRERGEVGRPRPGRGRVRSEVTGKCGYSRAPEGRRRRSRTSYRAASVRGATDVASGISLREGQRWPEVERRKLEQIVSVWHATYRRVFLGPIWRRRPATATGRVK